jgi:hypothetical protein
VPLLLLTASRGLGVALIQIVQVVRVIRVILVVALIVLLLPRKRKSAGVALYRVAPLDGGGIERIGLDAALHGKAEFHNRILVRVARILLVDYEFGELVRNLRVRVLRVIGGDLEHLHSLSTLTTLLVGLNHLIGLPTDVRSDAEYGTYRKIHIVFNYSTIYIQKSASPMKHSTLKQQVTFPMVSLEHSKVKASH